MKRSVSVVTLVVLATLLLPGAASANDEPKPDFGMAGKITVPTNKHGHGGINYAAECTVTSFGPRTRSSTATTRSRTTSPTSRSTRPTRRT